MGVAQASDLLCTGRASWPAREFATAPLCQAGLGSRVCRRQSGNCEAQASECAGQVVGKHAAWACCTA